MSDIKLVQEWFKYSQNDLISAQHLYNDLHPKQTEVACYLSQQCAEKALKGYLFFKDTEPQRTHNLVELCQICMTHDNTFSEILDACADLTPYGVAVRYPNELAVDDTIAKSAIDKAQSIYDFCTGKVARRKPMTPDEMYQKAMEYDLLGPDAEKNTELARELLEKAAAAGHKGAISELEDWYHATMEDPGD